MMKPQLEMKTPGEEKDYGVDWDPYLTAGVTITTSTWEIVSALGSPDLAIDADDIDGRATVVRLSGGQDDFDYVLVNKIVTSEGEKLNAAIEVRVRNAAEVAGIF